MYLLCFLCCLNKNRLYLSAHGSKQQMFTVPLKKNKDDSFSFFFLLHRSLYNFGSIASLQWWYCLLEKEILLHWYFLLGRNIVFASSYH